MGSNVVHWAEYTWPHCWAALAVRPEGKGKVGSNDGVAVMV